MTLLWKSNKPLKTDPPKEGHRPSQLFYEKYIYSILATESRKKKKKERKPEVILHPYTDTNNTVAHNKVGHQVPSLENWGGGLKSLLWHANSPHTQ